MKSKIIDGVKYFQVPEEKRTIGAFTEIVYPFNFHIGYNWMLYHIFVKKSQSE